MNYVTEADIMQDLFQNEDAMGLVRDIASIGFLTHELPVVVESENAFVVVEGNRRLAALKAIQNPFLVPRFKSRIDAAAATIEDRSSLRKVEVKVAPSQEDADVLIATIHTGNQRRSWSRVRQAAFFEAQIAAGLSIEQLQARYPTIDVRSFAKRVAMLNAFRSVSYSDPDDALFVEKRRFPVTVLERLYSNAEFRSAAGLTMDDSSGRTLVDDPDRFAVVANRVINDIRTKAVDTRRLNSQNSVGFQEYVSQIGRLAEQPERSRKSSSASTNSDAEADSNSQNNGASAEPKDNARASRKGYRRHLDCGGLHAPQGYPVMAELLGELESIDIVKFPNATMDLLRTFLEKGIKTYAERSGESIPKQGPFVQLKDCVKWIEGKVGAAPNGVALKQVVRKLDSNSAGNYYVASQDHLNAINHNNRVSASSSDVVAAWTTMHALIEFLLK